MSSTLKGAARVGSVLTVFPEQATDAHIASCDRCGKRGENVGET